MRRGSISLAVLAAVTAVSMVACAPSYPKCSSDENCKDHGEVCVQGECRECVTDQNCKEGFVCQQNKCMPKPECTDDASCGPNRKCQAGKCSAATAARGTCTKNTDCDSGQECRDGVCAAGDSGRAQCNFEEPVRFGFDESGLSPEAQQQLSSIADCLKRGSTRLRLEGHADERGTEEYNLQLSNRRAASVQKYLADLGVPRNKLDSVGYGETRPTNPGHNEAAWAQNRRVELKQVGR
jgi:peptidoglycan-associated lipoprotein